MRIETGISPVGAGLIRTGEENRMNKTTYGITDMNGLSGQDGITFSYFGNQNEAEGTDGGYSYQNMNGCTGEKDVSFSYTAMNGR